jgi:hypothetical protein
MTAKGYGMSDDSFERLILAAAAVGLDVDRNGVGYAFVTTARGMPVATCRELPEAWDFLRRYANGHEEEER